MMCEAEQATPLLMATVMATTPRPTRAAGTEAPISITPTPTVTVAVAVLVAALST